MKQQNEQKNSNAKKHHGWLAAVTGLLFVAICVTAALLASILKVHVTDDADAIALVPSHVEGVAENTVLKESNISESISVSENIISGSEPEATAAPFIVGSENTSVVQSGDSQTTSAAQSVGSGTASSGQGQQTSIGFIEEVVNVQLDPEITVYDSVKTWETATEVDIFKISYENGEAVVTVDGVDDKVIAPGTGNEYTFYLKNTGNVKLDYTLAMEAYFTPNTQPIPIEVRLKGYDGTYLLGDEDSWADVLKLNQVKDEASISVNRYAYYTLEWQWPFESGDDAYDTLLGNLAVDEDLTLTIVIKTVATGEDMTTEIQRTEITITGDDANLTGWIGLSAVTVALLVVMMLRKECNEKGQEKADEKE